VGEAPGGPSVRDLAFSGALAGIITANAPVRRTSRGSCDAGTMSARRGLGTTGAHAFIVTLLVGVASELTSHGRGSSAWFSRLTRPWEVCSAERGDDGAGKPGLPSQGPEVPRRRHKPRLWLVARCEAARPLALIPPKSIPLGPIAVTGQPPGRHRAATPRPTCLAMMWTVNDRSGRERCEENTRSWLPPRSAPWSLRPAVAAAAVQGAARVPAARTSRRPAQ